MRNMCNRNKKENNSTCTTRLNAAKTVPIKVRGQDRRTGQEGRCYISPQPTDCNRTMWKRCELLENEEADYPGIITQRPCPKCALNTAVIFQTRTLVTSSRCGPIEERGDRDSPSVLKSTQTCLKWEFEIICWTDNTLFHYNIGEKTSCCVTLQYWR